MIQLVQAKVIRFQRNHQNSCFHKSSLSVSSQTRIKSTRKHHQRSFSHCLKQESQEKRQTRPQKEIQKQQLSLEQVDKSFISIHKTPKKKRFRGCPPKRSYQKQSKGELQNDLQLQLVIQVHPCRKRKYIIIDPDVGKSCLLLRFIDDSFTQNYQSTLGVQFGSKTFALGQTAVKTMIWDTAGQQSFKSIIRSYYKNSILAILVFDLTDVQSFEDLGKWIQEVKTHANEQTRIVLVGNKEDLKQQRKVSKQQAEQFASTQNMMYFEVSAKTGFNVSEIFIKSSEQLVKDIQSKKLIITSNNQNLGVKRGNPNLIPTDRYSNNNINQKLSIQVASKVQDKSNKCEC